MAPKIYSSPFPSVRIVERSVFTHIFTANDGVPLSRTAYVDAATGLVLTRGQLLDLCLQFAWGVRNELPRLGGIELKRGDTVLIFSPNSIAWPVVLNGCIAAGLRTTLANSSYTPREVLHQWVDSGARLAFVHPTLVPVVVDTLKLHGMSDREVRQRIVTAGWKMNSPSPEGFITMEELLGKDSFRVEERFDDEQTHETAVLCYSSGTTGKPKGVETTHQNLTTAMDILNAGYGGFTEKDVIIGFLPFYHIYALLQVLCFAPKFGVPSIVMSRFDPETFCQVVEKYQVTLAPIVPPVLVALARHPAVNKYRLQTLRILLTGAAPAGAALLEAVAARLKIVGSTPLTLQAYGLTETSPTTHFLAPGTESGRLGTVGFLLPNLEARIVADGTRDAELGEPGELWIRGPSVMKGYLNNESATRNAIRPDGFFKTGDVAVIDKDGYYTIVDRQKELIKYKGFQVPPADLESLLLEHPDIADAGVVGVESVEEATELPRAYVVPVTRLGTDVEREGFGLSVQKWVAERVANHKRLRGGVIVVDAIPKSPSGKILRRELRERARNERNVDTRAKL